MHTLEVEQIIGGKRYNTETATLIAGDDYWDGHNYERRNTNCFLFRSPNGSYFSQHRSQWQGADDGALTAHTQDEAMRLYEQLREKRLPFEAAFPGVKVVDA